MSDRTTIERHDPERAPSRLDAVAPAGCCCCCCCCCCLHTVGGIVGGVIGSVQDIPPARRIRFNDDDDDEPFPSRRDAFEDDAPLPVPMLYWLLVLFLGAATAGVTFLGNGRGEPGMLIVGGLIAVMALPALQLGASFLTLILVRLFYEDSAAPLRRVGRITLYSLTGALIGLVLMIGGCVALGGMAR
ncbi:MAG: hypothetical protein ACRC33_31875 [Gemmataceae bacterium]